MQVLVVGGTGFLGGAVVDAAIAAGHEVTTFTRGRHERPSPGALEAIIGDRHGDLAALRGRRFDLVVDTCAFSPDAVERLLVALSPSIGRYAFVSSASVYADFSRPDVDENATTQRATADQLAFAHALPSDQRASAASYGSAYGPLKREAELVALDRLGDRVLILRSGLLVGAGDYTDRLTYWVRRIDQGGRLVAPGDPQRRVQLIDVGDAAAFIASAASRGLGGVFNLTGEPFPFAALLKSCRSVANSDATLVWIADAVLEAADIAPWSEAPLWLPASDVQSKHFLEISAAKAIAHGLTFRPLDETLLSILAWDRLRRSEPLKAGLPPSKEKLLLHRN